MSEIRQHFDLQGIQIPRQTAYDWAKEFRNRFPSPPPQDLPKDPETTLEKARRILLDILDPPNDGKILDTKVAAIRIQAANTLIRLELAEKEINPPEPEEESLNPVVIEVTGVEADATTSES